MSDFLDVNAGLSFTDNDKELYKELLNLYINEADFDSKYFCDLIMKSKIEAANYIHRIKGASRQIGATLLSEKSQVIEDILREKSKGSLPQLINEFCEIYTKTLKVVKKEIGNY